MFNSLVVRKDTIRDTGIPVVLARGVGKRSTFGMLRGPQSWPGPGWGHGQGQGPLLPHQTEQDFCTSVSGVSQGTHMWVAQYVDIPRG